MARESVLLVSPNLGRGWEEFAKGLLCLGAVLEEAGYPVEIVDLNFDEDWDRYAQLLKQRDFRMIGFTGLSRYAPDLYEAIRIAKDIAPNATAVLGGPHATALPEEALANSLADVLVYGEGELTVLDVADAVHRDARLDDVPGLYVRKNGQVAATPTRPFIEDLDTLPFPAYHLLPHMPRYIDALGQAASMFTRRGCPGNCLYCQPVLERLFGKKVRARGAHRVLDEMQLLQQLYGVSTVLIRDDTFCSRESYLKEFADEYDRRGMRMEWHGQARVNELTDSKMQYLRRTRCRALCFGFETGSQRMLDLYRKHTSLEQAYRAADLCKRDGILVLAAIMLGGPTEAEADADETIRFVKRIDPDVLDPHIVTPTPGSDLFYTSQSGGLLKDFDLDQLTEREHVTCNLSEMDDATLQGKLEELWQEYRCARRGSRAYYRWRMEQIRGAWQRRELRPMLTLIFLTFIKGVGPIYRIVHMLGRVPLPFRGVLKKIVWGG